MPSCAVGVEAGTLGHHLRLECQHERGPGRTWTCLTGGQNLGDAWLRDWLAEGDMNGNTEKQIWEGNSPSGMKMLRSLWNNQG